MFFQIDSIKNFCNIHSPVDTGRKLNVHIRRSIYVLCLRGGRKQLCLTLLLKMQAWRRPEEGLLRHQNQAPTQAFSCECYKFQDQLLLINTSGGCFWKKQKRWVRNDFRLNYWGSKPFVTSLKRSVKP